MAVVDAVQGIERAPSGYRSTIVLIVVCIRADAVLAIGIARAVSSGTAGECHQRCDRNSKPDPFEIIRRRHKVLPKMELPPTRSVFARFWAKYNFRLCKRDLLVSLPR
jgi:hypothetical protein